MPTIILNVLQPDRRLKHPMPSSFHKRRSKRSRRYPTPLQEDVPHAIAILPEVFKTSEVPSTTNTHALRRAHERYGLTLTGTMLKEICQLIRANAFIYVRALNSDRAIYAGHYQGCYIRVLCNRHNSTIITFLPIAD